MLAQANLLKLEEHLNRVVLNELDPNTKRKGNCFTLQNPEVLEHLLGHLLVKPGDILKVLILEEGLGHAKVLQTSPNEITLEVELTEKGLSQNIHLIIGASRPPTLKKILEHGTSFGVSSFSFFKAELSEKSYLTSKVFEPENVSDLLHKGLAQGSSFCHLPTVTRHTSLRESLKDSAPQRFLLSLNGDQTFASCNVEADKPMTLAIGPERGWTQKEEEFLVAQGFKPILIGPSTLRVEIAAFSALGQLAMLALNR